MDPYAVTKDFPMLTTHPELVYLDTAATALTPQSVIDATCAYYTTFNANVARGLYRTSTEVTTACASARERIAAFIGITDPACVIFTSGTTMSLNMVATGMLPHITQHHNVVTTIMEHHANFIPWQRLCTQTDANFRVAPLTDDGIIDTAQLLAHIDTQTALIALTYVSNTLGSINPLKKIIRAIRKKNPSTLIVIDAAQAVAHIPIDLSQIDCDIIAFSLHKLYGPTGIGILAGKRVALEQLEPLIVGGEMITTVSTSATSYADLPHRLEGGTPHIAGIMAAGAAVDYITTQDRAAIATHERTLAQTCIARLHETFGNAVHIYGPTDTALRSNIISFTLDHCHPHDLATILDTQKHVAVRAGQHCTMPLHLESLRIPATLRVSFGMYNTDRDIDALIHGLVIARDILAT